MPSPVKPIFLILLLTTLIMPFAGWAQTPEAPPEVPVPPDLTIPSGVDLSSPRATLQSFMVAMGEVDAGDDAAIARAIGCLYLDNLEGVSGEERAVRLYEILQRLVFSSEDVRVPDPSQKKLDVTLGRNGKEVSLSFYRHDDRNGVWMLNTATLETGNLEKMEEAVGLGEPESEEDGGDDFVEGLESPRVAMMTFIHGMNETHGLTPDDALKALDLSEVSQAVRLETGYDRALQLKFFLDRHKRIEETELPLEHEGDFVFYRRAAGKVILSLTEDEADGGKAWRFSKGTMEQDNITRLYESKLDAPLAQGVQARAEKLSVGIRLRDWMGRNASPFFTKRAFYLQNYQWLGLFVIVFLGMLLSRIATLTLASIIERIFRRARYRADRQLVREFVRPIRITLMAWIWYLALNFLLLPPEALAWLKVAALVVTAIGAAWTAFRLIDIVGNYLQERATRTESKFDDLLVPILTKSLKIFAVLVCALIVAGRYKDDLAGLLAGLGLGGLAFALAAKDVVANLFGSMTILLDRPFQIGDWITVGDIDGSVETVGIRSTQVRTFYNSLITVPNSELVNTHIDNMGARRYRRIKTMVSIAYDTPPEKIEAFCEGIREFIRKHPYTRKDYYHVYLNQFAASSLEVLVYCFVETPDWGTELRERHRLFLDITRLAERLGVEFAFPTQTLYMRQESAPAHERGKAPADAMAFGRRQATDIVREFTGLGVVPPAVDFDIPTEENRGESSEEDDDGDEGN